MSDSQAKKSLHPLIAIAAVSVTVLSLVGVAAMTGLLPGSKGEVNSDSTNSTNSTLSALAPDNKDGSATGGTGVDVPQSASAKHSASNTASGKNASNHHTDKTSDDAIAVEKPAKPICNQCGVVESVRSIEQKAEKGSGVGAVAGAVLGGVLGHQVGGGNGRKLATVAGAVGGGYAGNEIERSRNTHIVYEVKVKMENGELRTFKPEHKPEWRAGDRVKLVDGRLISNE